MPQDRASTIARAALAKALGSPLRAKDLEGALTAARTHRMRHPGDERGKTVVEALELLLGETWLGGRSGEGEPSAEFAVAAEALGRADLGAAERLYNQAVRIDPSAARARQLLHQVRVVKAAWEGQPLPPPPPTLADAAPSPSAPPGVEPQASRSQKAAPGPTSVRPAREVRPPATTPGRRPSGRPPASDLEGRPSFRPPSSVPSARRSKAGRKATTKVPAYGSEAPSAAGREPDEPVAGPEPSRPSAPRAASAVEAGGSAAPNVPAEPAGVEAPTPVPPPAAPGRAPTGVEVSGEPAGVEAPTPVPPPAAPGRAPAGVETSSPSGPVAPPPPPEDAAGRAAPDPGRDEVTPVHQRAPLVAADPADHPSLADALEDEEEVTRLASRGELPLGKLRSLTAQDSTRGSGAPPAGDAPASVPEAESAPPGVEGGPSAPVSAPSAEGGGGSTDDWPDPDASRILIIEEMGPPPGTEDELTLSLDDIDLGLPTPAPPPPSDDHISIFDDDDDDEPGYLDRTPSELVVPPAPKLPSDLDAPPLSDPAPEEGEPWTPPPPRRAAPPPPTGAAEGEPGTVDGWAPAPATDAQGEASRSPDALPSGVSSLPAAGSSLSAPPGAPAPPPPALPPPPRPRRKSSIAVFRAVAPWAAPAAASSPDVRPPEPPAGSEVDDTWASTEPELAPDAAAGGPNADVEPARGGGPPGGEPRHRPLAPPVTAGDEGGGPSR
ncbi:MAG: hypothetical protein ACFCGT_17520, partial [Sandaracinaceae bacterium]